MNHKHVDIFGRIVVDALLIILLLGILVVPLSTLSLVSFTSSQSQVLSQQDARQQEVFPEATTAEPAQMNRGQNQQEQITDDENIVQREVSEADSTTPGDPQRDMLGEIAPTWVGRYQPVVAEENTEVVESSNNSLEDSSSEADAVQESAEEGQTIESNQEAE